VSLGPLAALIGPIMTTSPTSIVLALSVILLSCASAPAPVPEIVIAPGSAVTTDQLQALQQSLAAYPHADWIEISERPAQMVGISGRTTYLWAEALRIPRKVSPHLCQGEFLLFSMRDEGFDTNTWRSFPLERYATYDAGGIDPCAQAREPDRRFWVRGGVSMDELAGVLEVFTATVSADEAASSLATLGPDERIILVTKKATLANESVIDITTSQGDSHGRIIEFEKREGRWIGRLRSNWIA